MVSSQIKEVQLDALMGSVNAMQEMLFRSTDTYMAVLPACPEAFEKGSVKNWRFPGGKISFEWNKAEKKLEMEITADKDICLKVEMPEWCGKNETEISLKQGDTLYIR